LLINRPRSFVLGLTVAFTLGACQEQLRGGNACPSLCPEQQLGFKDTTFEASEVIDTAVTLSGVPSIGTEPQLLVARYAQTGDSVVSYAVFRFDSLVRKVPLADSLTPRPFVSVDSSYLAVYALPAPTGQDTIYIQDTVTFELYDVWVNAPDFDTALVHARFTGTPVGSLTLPRDSVKGVLRIPIDTAFLTQSITSGKRVWLGLMVRSKGNAQVAFASEEGSVLGNGEAPFISYVGHADTAIGVVKGDTSLAGPYGPAVPALGDWQLNVIGAPPVPAGMLAVGGLPSNRTLIRFKFPAWLVDSSTTVVRANLELHQAPFTAFRADSDSLFLQPLVAIAGPAVTDLSKIGILLLDNVAANQLQTAMKLVKLPAAATTLDTIPLVRTGANLFNFWRRRGSAIQRAIVLTLAGEGAEPRELLFYGPTAAPALRPRVHVSYVPHSAIGLP